MTYEPTEWKSGDVVTSQKLNKLENGVVSASSGGGLVVNFTLEAGTGDYDGYYIWVTETPAADVIAAIKAGTNVVFYLPGSVEVGILTDQWIPVMVYAEALEGAAPTSPFGMLSTQSYSISDAYIEDGEIIIEAITQQAGGGTT